MVDGFARVADRKSFQKLVDQVFVDDITWGRIVTLICLVAKSILKVCNAFLISTYTVTNFSPKLILRVYTICV